MASDDDLDRFWREGLAELAPAPVEPDAARVGIRRAHLRRRRMLTLSAATALVIVAAAGIAAVATAGDSPRRVQTSVQPPVATSPETTTPGTIPAGTIPAGAMTTVPTVTIAPGSTLPPDTSAPVAVPTTLPAGTSVVTLTLDDNGLRATPPSAPAGMVDFMFVDARTAPGGFVEVRIEVQPDLGGWVVVGTGAKPLLLLCPHQWFLTTRVAGGQLRSIPFNVDGVAPECTTPIT